MLDYTDVFAKCTAPPWGELNDTICIGSHVNHPICFPTSPKNQYSFCDSNYNKHLDIVVMYTIFVTTNNSLSNHKTFGKSYDNN
jgi:hypothetical protein